MGIVLSLSKIESIVEALVPLARTIEVGVESPGVLVVVVTCEGRPNDRDQLQARLTAVLARTIEQRFRVEVRPVES